MTHKQQIHDALIQEIKLCKRLFTLLPEGSYDYRPQEGMRSTLELLQYISFITSTTLECFNFAVLEDGYALYETREKESFSLKPEDFLSAMDEEILRVNNFMNSVTEEDLQNREVSQSWRVKRVLGYAIIESALKWITGYKMQLFLYAKMSGVKELDTGDCWFIT